MPKIAVVGAGLSGLSAAIYLERNGQEVVLFEASNRVGGRVTSDEVNGFICDRGFQVINPSYSEIRRLKALDGIEFSQINTNIRIDGIKYGTRHLINDLAALPKLREKVLNPFLKGVFLNDPKNIPKKIANEITRSFIFGRPGVPDQGVRVFSENLADRVSNIQLNAVVENISKGKVSGNFGSEKFDAIIVATDPTTSVQLTGEKEFVRVLPSYTWYHTTQGEIPESQYLSINSSGSLVNSIVISEISKTYSPQGYSLIASTSLEPISESQVKQELRKLWGVETAKWELVSKYEIKQSLALNGEALKPNSKISENLYIAGDHRDVPSQNGALRSGRRAALAVLKDLNIH